MNIEPISMMVTDHSDGNTNKHSLDTNGTVHERPMKKPKVEVDLLPKGFLDPIVRDKPQPSVVVSSPVSLTEGENGVSVNEKKKEVLQPEGFFDPIIRDKPQPSVVVSPVSSTEGENGIRVNEKNKEVASSSLSKQFWKAGDYENYGNNSESTVVPPGGMDHLRVHPRFLHSNATSHKWALGAFAELLDNSLDEVRTGATYVKVDVLKNEKDTRSKMLLIEDNGGGMTPDKMRGCMSLGYSEKSKLANTIGQYGNGFKTSTMRLGADVLVFTRNQGEDLGRPTQSIGMLSYTFLMETGKQDIVVPMIDFEKRGEEWVMMPRSSVDHWKKNMNTLVQWSPYTSEEHLLQQFDHLDDQGTRIIIYNIWEDEEGQLELDFDTDVHDIQIRGARDPQKIEMAKNYPNSRHFLTYRHSFRSYASILYLRIPVNFRMILRGKDVIHHNIVNDMMMSQRITYKPAQPAAADGVTKNDKNQMSADVTIGFVKDAKDHIDVQGFNVYHKNRLIKPFWRVWNAAGSDGRGVIGVLEADFVEPAHDKQGFERTTVLQRLENRLVIMQKKYWSTNCQHIGYAKRIKSAPDAKPKPSVGDLSDEDIVSPGINTSGSKTEVRPIRNSVAAKPVDYSQYHASTSSKSPFSASTSSKVFKASTNSIPSKVNQNQAQPLNANGYASASHNGDIVEELRKENHELKQRGEGTDSEMINSLLKDLLSERDKNALLEKQLKNAEEKIQEAEKKIKNLDAEHEAIIEIFSEERSRQLDTESNLKQNLQDAMNTVEELRKQIKELENSKVRT